MKKLRLLFIVWRGLSLFAQCDAIFRVLISVDIKRRSGVNQALVGESSTSKAIYVLWSSLADRVITDYPKNLRNQDLFLKKSQPKNLSSWSRRRRLIFSMISLASRTLHRRWSRIIQIFLAKMCKTIKLGFFKRNRKTIEYIWWLS